MRSMGYKSSKRLMRFVNPILSGERCERDRSRSTKIDQGPQRSIEVHRDRSRSTEIDPNETRLMRSKSSERLTRLVKPITLSSERWERARLRSTIRSTRSRY
ncbi:hypothetical protein MJO28_010598 [Puccinia striiformis f. sp. tritici]|uniref:Uncharacterized protein n=2 Tax=Puccinia striiformis f. sp. tritici TaxID=168172 RepID=A0ACC0DYU2_9BASI|nr:hypothetical protein MJO28_013445 [Puccinia striiformis f. sp. tritici]KAI7944903.1 hypothetical protein MJO28_010598 [Puccinia striiformis f. sp. tritici]